MPTSRGMHRTSGSQLLGTHKSSKFMGRTTVTKSGPSAIATPFNRPEMEKGTANYAAMISR